jgi:Rap1a immunity proteins
MHTSKKILILIALAFFASASSADVGDGKWFVEACSLDSLKKIEKENKDKYLSQLAYCNAFVMGIIHGHYASRAAYKREPLFCLPQGRSNLELTGDVVGIVQSQPERQNVFAAALALQGLARMYPCKN